MKACCLFLAVLTCISIIEITFVFSQSGSVAVVDDDGTVNESYTLQESNQTSRMTNNPAHTALIMKSTLIEPLYREICPIAFVPQLLTELAMQGYLKEPFPLSIQLEIYRINRIDDISQTVTMLVEFTASWVYPCPSLDSSVIPEMANFPENLPVYINRTEGGFYPSLLHMNALLDVNIIKTLDSAISIFPGHNPPLGTTNGLKVIQSTCSFSYRIFPFDLANCDVLIEADPTDSILTISEVNCTFGIEGVPGILDSTDIWYLAEPPSFLVHKAVRYDGNYSTIRFKLRFRRKYHYYVSNLAVPLIVLFLLQVSSLILSPSEGDRASFCVTIVLSIVVILSLSLIPQTDETILVIILIEAKIGVCSVITFYTLITTQLSKRSFHWTKKRVLSEMITIARLADLVVAIAALVAVAFVYGFCLHEIANS